MDSRGLLLDGHRQVKEPLGQRERCVDMLERNRMVH